MSKHPTLGFDLTGLGHVPIPEPNILARGLGRISDAEEESPSHLHKTTGGMIAAQRGKAAVQREPCQLCASYYSEGFCDSCCTIVDTLLTVSFMEPKHYNALNFGGSSQMGNIVLKHVVTSFILPS